MRRTCHRRGTCAAFLLNNELGLFLSKLFPKHEKSKKVGVGIARRILH